MTERPKPMTFTVHADNREQVDALIRGTEEPYFVNGMMYSPGEERGFELRDADTIMVMPGAPSVIDEIAKLAAEPEPEPPDNFIVVPCVAPEHRRINDALVVDPRCPLCMGLGIVRVHKDHIPIIHRRDDKWERGDDVVSRIADIC